MLWKGRGIGFCPFHLNLQAARVKRWEEKFQVTNHFRGVLPLKKLNFNFTHGVKTTMSSRRRSGLIKMAKCTGYSHMTSVEFLVGSCCWRHFLFLVCMNIWVPGNDFSMPRFVCAFTTRVRARAESVAVLHSKRKHVRSNNLYSTHLTHSAFWVPARGIAYTNITHNVIPLSLCKYTLFS